MNNSKINSNKLIELFENKEATIGIIGLGYVGLPLLLTYVEKGYKVIGFDIDLEKVDLIGNGKSYIKHINDDRIQKAVDTGLIKLTSKFDLATQVNALILCLPTPLNKNRDPDLSYIHSTMELLTPELQPGQILSLESTTYPGTTEEELKPIIEDKGLHIGKNFFLVYSPEREDPGNKNYSTTNIPKVLGGITAECLKVGTSLYKCIIDKVVPVSSTKAAEMTKLLENIHRAINISLMNELKPVADAMGIDLYEVIRAAETKPFGFVPYYPGPGMGGHCIPIDPFYLTWKARQYGMNTRFIELAGEINDFMITYVYQKVIEALNKDKLPINGSNILILGLSYKKNIDDTRESPSVKILDLLIKNGASVKYSDPYVKQFPVMRDFSFDLESIELTPQSLETFDATLLLTDHDIFDYEMIEKYSARIIDTRGHFKVSDKVIRA